MNKKTLMAMFLMLMLTKPTPILAGQETGDRIPMEFDSQSIESDLTWKDHFFTNVVILKWKKESDDRPLYVESAIILADLDGQYALAHIYRHPREENSRPKWRLSIVYDVPQIALELFNSRPSRKDLNRFEKGSWWKDVASEGFKLIDSAVCNNNIRKFLKN